jgi:hypothetical protein
VGEGVRLAGHLLVAELRADPFGIDDQQHQVRRVTVVRVGHHRDLCGRGGVDEALLGQGPAPGGHRVLPVAPGPLPVGLFGDVVDEGHPTGV